MWNRGVAATWRKVPKGPFRTVFSTESDSVVFYYSVVNLLRIVIHYSKHSKSVQNVVIHYIFSSESLRVVNSLRIVNSLRVLFLVCLGPLGGVTTTCRNCNVAMCYVRSNGPCSKQLRWRLKTSILRCKIFGKILKGPCEPIPPKFYGWQIHPLNLGGGVSGIPCFTALFGGPPLNLGGEMPPPEFRGYGLTRGLWCRWGWREFYLFFFFAFPSLRFSLFFFGFWRSK